MVTQIGISNVHAATYYWKCLCKFRDIQQPTTLIVTESDRKRKYSAVKVKAGVAAHVDCFFNKDEAKQYNELMGYTSVVKGVQTVGQPLLHSVG